MAKVVIEIIDQPGKKNLSISLTSTPEWDVTENSINTPAQIAGISFLDWLVKKEETKNISEEIQ